MLILFHLWKSTEVWGFGEVPVALYSDSKPSELKPPVTANVGSKSKGSLTPS